ncbi:MAG: hypothetical protein R2754_15665 [Microthrixaceae bacterium]
MTSLPLASSGRHAVYTGRTTSWPMVASTCFGALLIVLMGRQATAPWSDLSLPLLLVAIGGLVNLLTASSVRATAGPNGLTIRWGLVGWPRCHYRLDEIANAEVIDLAWWRVSWGFWWTPKRTCSTVRSGPTVKLTLLNHRTVTLTVPEPDAVVAALTAPSTGDPVA